MPDDNADDTKRHTALEKLGLLAEPCLPEFQDLCARAQEQLRAPVAMVKLVDNDRIILAAQAGIDLGESLPRHEAFSDYTIRSDEVFVVPDATKDPRFAGNQLVQGQRHIRFYAGAPLIYRRELRLGSFCVFDMTPREFSLGDRAELAGLADEVIGLLIQRDIAMSAGLFKQ
jgi:GAF domain-containing protein